MKTRHLGMCRLGRDRLAKTASMLRATWIGPGPQNRPRQQGPLGKSWLTSQAYRLPAALIR